MLAFTLARRSILLLPQGWVVRARGPRHPIDLGTDSVRAVVSDASAGELLMGCRRAVRRCSSRAAYDIDDT
ncbi:hypothetical protein BE04_22110 [Sorangium cellulosum]|uniref:Uncharacterized protein n=1 Tax=Sorangium cellulosum TaxID=56 RepID=A0A150PET2_SORCE|nr:hypothetical protein BE04_22110 [Sorangium cellulosum]KYG06222.1 hypothetical protein BE21_36080 [Sorangium cellulosum]